YLNIVMVPVLIGVTVDASVHLWSRLSDTSVRDFHGIFGETGRAIAGGLFSSAIGFGTLLLAAHPGLASIGQLALLGLGTNAMVTLLGFPALLLILAGYSGEKGELGPGGASKARLSRASRGR